MSVRLCLREQRMVRFQLMNDLIYICVMGGFFVVAALYAHLCEKL
jgi:hypothetical protein